MRFLLSFLLLLFLTSDKSYSQNNRDTSFNHDGLVLYDGTQDGRNIAIQPDGKIIVGGSFNEDFLLIRYNPSGSLDNGFGSGGVVITDYNNKDQGGSKVLLQPDGKILLAGSMYDTSFYSHFLFIRYNSDGSPDTTFGTNGIASTNFLGAACNLTACTLLPDGKFIAGGLIRKRLFPFGFEHYVVVAQYNADGSLDTLFGDSGSYITPLSLNLNAASGLKELLVLTNGQILAIAQFGITGMSPPLVLIRFNSDGSLDNTYYNNGMFISNFGINQNGVGVRDALTLQSGKILLVANTNDTTDFDIFIARLNDEGIIDSSFGTNGYLRADYTPEIIDPLGQAIELSNGRIAISSIGTAFSDGNYSYSLRMILFDSDGGLIGAAKDELPPTYEPYVRDVALQADGKVLLVGGMSNISYYYPDSLQFVELKTFLLRYQSELAVGLIEFTQTNTAPLLYPNPLQQTETLKYTLAEAEQISITLIDSQGKLVDTFLENENQAKGEYEIKLTLPPTLSPGTYFIQIASPKGTFSIKAVK